MLVNTTMSKFSTSTKMIIKKMETKKKERGREESTSS